jgi:hypothetical protein
MFASAAVIFSLGLLHLIYTFWGPKLRPRDTELQAAMNKVSPVISKETTMWRCWIGVNATHSMSLILFGVIYGFLALEHPELLFHSTFLLAVGFATLCGFFVLAKLYFFSIPFAGITISLICFIASIVASRFS